MSESNDAALAATAVGLNEDAKAARKRGGKRDDSKERAEAHLYGEKGEQPPGAAQEPVSGEPTQDQTGDGGAAGQLFEKQLDAIEQLGDDAPLDARTAVADLRDYIIEAFKHRPKPWQQMSNMEQRDFAGKIEASAKEFVRRLVETIVADGDKDPIRVLLTKVNMSDDIQVVGKLKAMSPEEEERAIILLHAARGKHVLLTIASADDYAAKRDAKTDADEPTLGFEAGTDEVQAEDLGGLAENLETQLNDRDSADDDNDELTA